MNEVISILTPFQAVDFLAGAKKLHLCLHDWDEIADQPIAIITKELDEHGGPSRAEEALDEHAISVMSVLEEADNLRLDTMKELTNILTPVQAVDFLAAGKKLHLGLRAWGRRRDLENRRNRVIVCENYV
ncbi:hypothetical protein BUALT_Bualt03G0044500 [Buddleja alternifolia]|uniref:DOG1 domain-containing protein n=1 Tax=Buddleja alternifolia TaxID=168488 RepID=A0AAV6XVE8_9LAMI|nr:hypothetical protein BUALT_Bualt03G0044500 [Buddleja alternifolia]